MWVAVVAMVTKYVCRILVVQRVLVAVIEKVAGLIFECKVSILTFGDRKGLGYGGCKV